VLVVEDTEEIADVLQAVLAAADMDVVVAVDGPAGLAAARADDPDVVVLDLGLPDLSGLDVIKGLRAYSGVPIIVLSARTGTGDKVAALDLGADDYVTKPFSIDELLARLRAATRRSAPADASDVVQFGAARVDLDAKTAERDGEPVHLTPTEWHLLEALLRRPGKLVTGRALLTELRGSPDHTDPSYLRIYMAQLRRKLEPVPSRPQFLITEPGMGYRFQP
jgi:two-component system KDP operon response regulator KdpE